LTVAEVAQLCVGLATLLSAVASVILAVRGHELAIRTHTLVNGQSDTIQALREAKGHAEGLVEGEQLAAKGQARLAEERSDWPTNR